MDSPEGSQCYEYHRGFNGRLRYIYAAEGHSKCFDDVYENFSYSDNYEDESGSEGILEFCFAYSVKIT